MGKTTIVACAFLLAAAGRAQAAESGDLRAMLLFRGGMAAVVVLGVAAWYFFRRVEATASPEPTPAEPAGFWVRGGAFWLDFGVVALITAFAGLLLPDGQAAGILIAFAVGAAYHAGFLAHGGQTPGMMAAGVRVERGDGGALDVEYAFVRFLVRDLSSMLPIVYAVAAFNPRKLAVHDMVADTRVVFLPGVSNARRWAFVALGASVLVGGVVAVVIVFSYMLMNFHG